MTKTRHTQSRNNSTETRSAHNNCKKNVSKQTTEKNRVSGGGGDVDRLILHLGNHLREYMKSQDKKLNGLTTKQIKEQGRDMNIFSNTEYRGHGWKHEES